MRFISRKKKEPEFLLNWRLKAFRHWLTMTEPHWAKLRVNPIDYQGISYFSAPKRRPGSSFHRHPSGEGSAPTDTR